MSHPTLKIAITAGEPAGVGPDVVLRVAQRSFPAELVVIADEDLLTKRSEQLGINIIFNPFDPAKPKVHQANHLSIIHVPLKKPCVPGKLDPENASYVIETLQVAAEGALKKKFNAIVTGPVNKAVINQAGIKFLGHTEFFAEFSHTPEVVMMLVAKKMRVALATTHLPLAAVPKAITAEKLINILRILHAELQKHFGILQPRIFVAGLNPHAGENGQLGREEIQIISPALDKLREEGMLLTGPLAADTLFIPKYLQNADAILAMYHDQGLPVLKFYGFNQAVNITLGLPFIRTSVDHGTALELAGTHKADVGSLQAAISTAITMCGIPKTNAI